MGRFRYIALIIPLLVYTADCVEEDPFEHIQIQVLNSTSDKWPLLYAPADRLLQFESSVWVRVKTNTSCLIVSAELYKQDHFFTGENPNPLRDVVSNEISAKIGSYPLKLRWLLLGYSTYDSNGTLITTGWQPMASDQPPVNLSICCQTDAGCNETLTDLQNNPKMLASRLFLAFAQIAPSVRSAPMCIDTKHFSSNAIVNASVERLSTGQNYGYMQPNDYANFTKTLVASAVEKMMGQNEFVDEEQIDRLVSGISTVFPLNATTTENFTADMWAETIWTTESPDLKLRRLDDVLSSQRVWVRAIVANRESDPIPAPAPIWHAYLEAIYDSRMGFIDGKLVMKTLPLYRVNLEVLRQATPVCYGNVSFTRTGAEYSGRRPENKGWLEVDDATQKWINGHTEGSEYW